MTKASFVEAELENADFRGANCTGVDFSKSDLTGANFEGATFGENIFDETVFYKTVIDWRHLKGADLSTIQESATLSVNHLELAETIPVVHFFNEADIVFAGKWSGTLDDFKVWGENMPNHKHQMQILAMHQYFETRRNL